MAIIRIRNLFDRVLDIPAGDKPLLRHLQDNYIDWMQSCGAKGRCTTCKVIVHDGLENFSDDSEAEKRYRKQGALKRNEKLACQSKIYGDVTFSAPAEYKLPHIKYSGDDAG